MSNTRSAINKKAKEASHKSPATMPVLTRPALNSSNPHLLSWPPTQLRIRPAATVGPDDGDDEDSDIPILEREHDFGLYMDEEPLTYFLTPAPDHDDDGDLAMTMDFDAGIGASADAVDEVRSVSPSSLDGGSSRFRSPFRPPTPPRSPPGTTTDEDDDDDDYDEDDDDDDHEQYIRLGPTHGLPIPPFALKKRKGATRHARLASSASLQLPFPSSSSPRGRAPGRFGPGRGAATATATVTAPPPQRRRLSPRSWRQPSPDVWSIEEEPEREACELAAADAAGKTAVMDKPVKAKKRVRFVLPVKED